MKKSALINSDLSRIISLLGHTDMLTIGDAGLPVPQGVERVDLAIVKGLPSFMQVVEAVTLEMQVELVVMASEIKSKNESMHRQILAHIEMLEKQQGNHIAVEYVDHESFKGMTKRSKAVIRSGECSPFANVHFVSGVTF